MKKEQKRSVPQHLGKGFAHFQNGVDEVLFWGFSKLKKSSAYKKPPQNKGVKIVRNIGGFLGEMGSEYFEEYEKLKQKKRK